MSMAARSAFDDAFGFEVADRAFPIADADDAARRRDAAQALVGEIAVVAANDLHARMRDDDGPRRHVEHVIDDGGRGVGEIDRDAKTLQLLHDFASEIGETAFVDAVHRTAQFVVEEVGEADHAEARVVELLDVLEFSFEGVRAFDGEKRADEVGVRFLIGEQARHVGAGAHDAQLIRRLFLRAVEFFRLESARSRRLSQVRGGQA